MRKPRLVEEHEAAGKRIVVDGQHIFVREEGEGEPVLLLHGVPSSSFLFRKMLPELAGRGLRALSFDFPGVGLSDKPKEIDYDWHALATWIGRVVDTLALPPVHLILHDGRRSLHPAVPDVDIPTADDATRGLFDDEHSHDVEALPP
jgi:alpha-beta hydrolase superfamily lysophospholipase